MNPTETDRPAPSGIAIDYDHLDVADIMAQVKKRVAERPAEAPPDRPAESLEPWLEGEPSPPPPSGLKGKLKRILFRLMRPFAPVQKLLALPTHRELMETVRKLHQTNLRLERLVVQMDAEFRRVNQDIARSEGRLDAVNERLDITGENLQDQIDALPPRIDEVHREAHARIEEVHDELSGLIDAAHRTTNERINAAYAEIQRAGEFIKLLHNLSHNLVVELSKLKIEEEGLKLKARVMEKDFEFLGRREKALEKEILK
jgi:hypothetical protein